MKDKKVKEVMIPLSDYATVSEDGTFVDAIRILKDALKDTKHIRKHRALLVYDKNNSIIGKVSFRCFFKALEPKYCQFEHSDDAGSVGLSRFGFSDDFINSLVESFCLWDETLENLVKSSSKMKIKDIMYTPSNSEYVDMDAPVAEAVHQFILGCHQSLLVTKNDEVVGVIRLADLFDLVCDIVD